MNYMVYIAAKRINFLLTASENKLSSSWFVKRNCSLSSYCDIRLEALLEIPFILFNVPWDFLWNFPIWVDVSNLDSHARNCSSAEVKLSCSWAFGVFEHTIARFFKFVRLVYFLSDCFVQNLIYVMKWEKGIIETFVPVLFHCICCYTV